MITPVVGTDSLRGAGTTATCERGVAPVRIRSRVNNHVSTTRYGLPDDSLSRRETHQIIVKSS